MSVEEGPETLRGQYHREFVHSWLFEYSASTFTSRSPSNLNAVLEMCRHKLWMYLTLSDVDICKAKEESLKKMMKEYNDIESDLKLLHNICKYINIFNDQKDPCL